MNFDGLLVPQCFPKAGLFVPSQISLVISSAFIALASSTNLVSLSLKMLPILPDLNAIPSSTQNFFLFSPNKFGLSHLWLYSSCSNRLYLPHSTVLSWPRRYGTFLTLISFKVLRYCWLYLTFLKSPYWHFVYMPSIQKVLHKCISLNIKNLHVRQLYTAVV